MTTMTTALHTPLKAMIAGFGNWLVRLGSYSGDARAARDFARLNALSDAELAERGLDRSKLLQRFVDRLHWS